VKDFCVPRNVPLTANRYCTGGMTSFIHGTKEGRAAELYLLSYPAESGCIAGISISNK